MIIIPDVHGRTFWAEALSRRKDGEKIIFLGDYVDPYPSENISPEDAYTNFMDILMFRKNHPEDVIMLLGNHDLSYMCRSMMCSRHDYQRHQELCWVFMEGAREGAFRLIYRQRAGGRDFVFSHAGVHAGWYRDCCIIPGLEEEHATMDPFSFLEKFGTADYFHQLCGPLYAVSYLRGGTGDYGSPVWSDVREWPDDLDERDTAVYQIFGHTQCAGPVITGQFAMLDCRRPFRLDETTGELSELEI